MFTGIVQGTAPVIDIIKKDRFQTHILEFEPALLNDLQTGASGTTLGQQSHVGYRSLDLSAGSPGFCWFLLLYGTPDRD